MTSNPQNRLSRSRWRLIVAGAAVVASLVATLLAPTPSLAGTQTFSDPAGDAAAGVPDVTTISITPSADGTAYSIAVNLNGGVYASDFFLDVYIDTTGDNVAEYLVRLLGNENRIEIDRWDGSAWNPFTASILEGTSTLTPETIKLGRADIGGAQSFHFWLKAWKFAVGSQPACCFDYAGVFAYPTSDSGSGGSGSGGTSTRTLPPPPPPPPFEGPGGAPNAGDDSGSGHTDPSKPSDQNDKVSKDDTTSDHTSEQAVVSIEATAPKNIRANRRFTVDVLLHGATSGRVVCTVTVAGTRVGRVSATIRDGRSSCTLRLPAGARGKLARIAVDATAGAQTAHTTLRRRVA